MKLLMITRKVDKDDGLAGFVFNWVNKLGKKLEKLTVVCLEKGNIEGLHGNIRIISVRNNKLDVPYTNFAEPRRIHAELCRKFKFLYNNIFLRKIKDFIVFQKLIWQNIKKVDGIFCHMNPEYTIVVWPQAKLFHKRIVSWYAHKQVTFRLKLLEKMADKILTPSKQSFRLKSKKVKIIGHGIDIEKFKSSRNNIQNNIFSIISVGRISPTKDLETLIKAIDILINDKNIKDIKVEIIGSPGLKNHKTYYESLQKMVEKMNLINYVKFAGSIPNKNIPKTLAEANLFINLSNTGSLDKAILESMSCEVIPITSNSAFNNILPEECLTKQNDFRQLSQKILAIKNKNSENKNKIQKDLREIVIKNHNLDNLIQKIIRQFID